MIEYVAADSPAAEAGILKGDRVVAIDGASTQGMSATEALRRVEGEIGTVVTLTVRRDGAPDKDVAVTRQSLLATYLPAAMVDDPRAETSLGYYYKRGAGATRDPAKAIDWYRKAAAQGYAPAERELGICYLNGEGILQSDRDAFAWFYSAAAQDDASAQQYLATLYRKGQGVPQSNRDAFAWYYRSAQQHNIYGEWGLAYMYEKGMGVAPNAAEALKWYQKAQSRMPDDEQLKKDVALMSLKAYLENPSSASPDLALFTAAFHREVFWFFFALMTVYAVGGLALFYFTFRVAELPVPLLVAFGWLVFFLESQGVALLVLFLIGHPLTANDLLTATALFGALPIIASTCGPTRSRFWQAAPLPWKTLALYGVGAFFAAQFFDEGYSKIYGLITHSLMPSQPTQVLISKAKDASVWLTFANVALIIPAAEEIMFRGYLFGALRRRFSGAVVVVLTALAFSFVHFQALYFVPLFGFGLVLGWVRLRTDSLRLPLLLHAFNNGLFLVLTS